MSLSASSRRRRTAGGERQRGLIDESSQSGIFVNAIVLAEFAWTMRRAYKWEDDSSATRPHRIAVILRIA